MNSNILYKEIFNPWFKPLVIFLPPFYKYGIIIQQVVEEQGAPASASSQPPPSPLQDNQALIDDENDKDRNVHSSADLSITFGYGRTGPSGITSQTILLKEIDPSSIVTGTASAQDNLLEFGGWGIRYNFKTKTWAYNAINGPFIEFVHWKGAKQIRYRIVTNHVEEVVSFLLGKDQDKVKVAMRTL